MAILHQYSYEKPGSLLEAVTVLSRYNAPVILSGGTDIVGALKDGGCQPDVVVDIKGLSELKQIEFDGSELRIGALVTFTQIIESDVIATHFPVIMEMARTVASVGVRNRATLTGNICSAVPCMDSGPVVAAYDAEIIVEGVNGQRRIRSTDWFVKSRTTALRKDEMVVSVVMKKPAENYGACFVKLGRYSGEDLAQVNLTVLALPDNSFRIAYGSVAPVPVRARKIEELLQGRTIDETLMEKALLVVEEEISPISDIRASKEYRMHMAKVMLQRGLTTAINRMKGSGPAYGHSVI